MKKNLIATLLIAATASIAAPAFASGYGPAPYYRPGVGAPVSQQGWNTQTIAAQNAADSAEATSYGGSRVASSQSGSREQGTKAQAVFFGQ